MNAEIRQWAGPIPSPSPQELADRYAVSQLVKVYALGIDMRDLDLVRSVFTEDAVVEGTVAKGPAREYLPAVYAAAAKYSATQHNVTNQYVTIDGDQAVVWSYAVAYHIEEAGNGRDNLIVAVQYRDGCQRFQKGWLITSRKVALQWSNRPSPGSKA